MRHDFESPFLDAELHSLDQKLNGDRVSYSAEREGALRHGLTPYNTFAGRSALYRQRNDNSGIIELDFHLDGTNGGAADDEEQVPAGSDPGAIQTARQGIAWTRQVDELVRKQFKLGKPSLVGRVRYLDNARFSASLRPADIPELLLNLFLAPGPPAIPSILRQHHMPNWAEGLPDERQVLIRAYAAKLQKFIKERIRVGYFESRAFPRATITPRRLIAEHLLGLTTSAASRSGRRVLIQLAADVETVVHEACHFYSHSAFASAARKKDQEFFRGMRVSEIVSEGLTEHFARLVMDAHADILGPLKVNAYQNYVELIRHFITPLTKRDVEDAYFKGSVRTLMKAVDKGIEAYPLMVPGFALEHDGHGNPSSRVWDTSAIVSGSPEFDEFDEAGSEVLFGDDEVGNDRHRDPSLEPDTYGQDDHAEDEELDLAEYDYFEGDTAIDVKDAIRENKRLAKTLGWGKHEEAVKSYLSSVSGQTSLKTPEAFAKAVAEWQEKTGLDIDGKLGPDSWARMRLAIQPQGDGNGKAKVDKSTRFLLKYEGQPDKSRHITKADHEFLSDFIDRNIVDSTATVDRSTGEVKSWQIKYSDGRTVELDVSAIPLMFNADGRLVKLGFVDHYLKRKDGFIYPVFDGNVTFNGVQTPEIVRMRSYLYVKAKALKELWDLAMLTGFFADLIGKGGGTVSKVGSVKVFSNDPTALQLLKTL
jgi:hypothetical protein